MVITIPVVKTSLNRLLSLSGISNDEKLREILFNLKCETEIEDDMITIEVQSDRIDMFSVEGIAYAVKLYLGLTEPRYINSSQLFEVFVEPPLKRPYIAVAAVKDVKLNDEALKELIEFQEKLHITYGRYRRKVAIGLHDLSKLPSKIIVYKDVDIDKIDMMPLFTNERMTIREVLNSTEQGKLYGNIALHDNMHPAILADGEVISLPPVINSDITKLDSKSKDVFIDVTGTDLQSVMNVLNAIVHTLSFYGGEVLGSKIYYPNNIITSPDLRWKEIKVDTSFAAKWLGLNIYDLVEIGSRILSRMGYIVKEIDNEKIFLLVPPYRCDILHPVDIVEDIAIGIGYDNLGLEFVEPVRLAKSRFREEVNEKLVSRLLRDILLGLGYTEVNTLSLVSSKILELVSDESYLKIVNALSKEIDAVRNSLIVSALIVLASSQYVYKPVKIFEVGEVVTECTTCYNRWRNVLRVLWAVMDNEIRFEDIHADLYAVLREIDLAQYVVIENCRKKVFIDGRCGCVTYNGMEVGVIGEIHPSVLKFVGIEYPVSVVELDINKITEIFRTLRQ